MRGPSDNEHGSSQQDFNQDSATRNDTHSSSSSSNASTKQDNDEDLIMIDLQDNDEEGLDCENHIADTSTAGFECTNIADHSTFDHLYTKEVEKEAILEAISHARPQKHPGSEELSRFDAEEASVELEPLEPSSPRPSPTPYPERVSTPGAVRVVLRQPSSYSSVQSSTSSNNSNPEEGFIVASAELVDEELQAEVERLRRQVQASMSVPVIRAEMMETNQSRSSRSSLSHGENCYSDNAHQVPADEQDTRRDIPSRGCLGLGLAALILLIAAVCLNILLRDGAVPSKYSAMDIISTDPRLTSLHSLLEATGLADQLRSGLHGKVTVLAPTNVAFERKVTGAPRFPNYHNEYNVAHTRKLLQKHIFAGTINLTEAMDDRDFVMFSNESIQISVTTDNTTIIPKLTDELNVLEEGVITENGDTIHIIDGLVMPDFASVTLYDVANRLNLTATLAWVKQAGLDNIISNTGGVSILAPSNEADANLDPEIRERMLSDGEYLFLVILAHVSNKNFPVELIRLPENRLPDGSIGGVSNTIFVRSNVSEDGTVSLHLDNGRYANIVLADQLAFDGMIHVLDNFLIPD